MPKCGSLYTRALTPRIARASVELARDTLVVQLPNGGRRKVMPNGAEFHVRDAACAQRFVRHLALRHPDGRAHLVTPPDEGAIAPRAARLPVVPDGHVVVDTRAWDAVVDWLRGGGTLRQTLRPLEEAAAESPRAAEAWVAALSCSYSMA